MDRVVRAGLLGGFGVLVAKLFVAGQMAKYLSSGVDLLTAAAGGLMVLMAVAEARAAWSSQAVEVGHGARREPLEQALTYMLVAGTLLLGLALAPRALGTSALGGDDLTGALLAFSQRAARDPAAPHPTPPSRPIADVPDLLGYLDQVGEAGVGQPVRVAGLVARSAGLGPGEFALLRYAVVHCVADAQPIGVLVTSGPAWVEVDQWVQIEGVVGMRARDGSRLLTIEASSVTPTTEPGDPYVHPAF